MTKVSRNVETEVQGLKFECLQSTGQVEVSVCARTLHSKDDTHTKRLYFFIRFGWHIWVMFFFLNGRVCLLAIFIAFG